MSEAQSDKLASREDLERLSQDAVGFGTLELRAIRALLLRPREALEQWMTLGPTAGGLYARPLRLYLSICGVMMLIMFLSGTDGELVKAAPRDFVAGLAKGAGKSLESYMGDVGNWMNLLLVPLTSALYALVAAPLLRWWDPENLGWRRGSRATFVFLSAWSIPIVPLTWWVGNPDSAVWASLVIVAAALYTFVRMGKSRWWRTPLGAGLKGLTLTMVLLLTSMIAYAPLFAICFAGAYYIG